MVYKVQIYWATVNQKPAKTTDKLTTLYCVRKAWNEWNKRNVKGSIAMDKTLDKTSFLSYSSGNCIYFCSSIIMPLSVAYKIEINAIFHFDWADNFNTTCNMKAQYTKFHEMNTIWFAWPLAWAWANWWCLMQIQCYNNFYQLAERSCRYAGSMLFDYSLKAQFHFIPVCYQEKTLIYIFIVHFRVDIVQFIE